MDSCRSFFYGAVIQRVFNQTYLVVSAQANGSDDAATREKLEKSWSLVMSGGVFIQAVRLQCFKEYVFLDVVLQLFAASATRFRLNPFSNTELDPKSSVQTLLSRRHVYLIPVALNLSTSLISMCYPKWSAFFRCCDFLFEFMVSIINARQLSDVLLKPAGWSRMRNVSGQLTGIVLLELATWSPWRAVAAALSGRGLDSEAMQAVGYCLCGMMGLALFYYFRDKDQRDGSEKQRRMKDHAMYELLYDGWHANRQLFQQGLQDTVDAPVQAAQNKPSQGKDFARAALKGLGLLSGSSLPGFALFALDFRQTVERAKEAKDTVMNWMSGDSEEPPDLLRTNAVNIFVTLIEYADHFPDFEIVVLFAFVLFYYCMGFAQPLTSIFGDLPDDVKFVTTVVMSIFIGAIGLIKWVTWEPRPAKPESWVDGSISTALATFSITEEDGSRCLVAQPSSTDNNVDGGILKIEMIQVPTDALPLEAQFVFREEMTDQEENLAPYPDFLQPLFRRVLFPEPGVIWRSVRTTGERPAYLVAEAEGKQYFKTLRYGEKVGHDGLWSWDGLPHGGHGRAIRNRLGQQLTFQTEAGGAQVVTWKICEVCEFDGCTS